MVYKRHPESASEIGVHEKMKTLEFLNRFVDHQEASSHIQGWLSPVEAVVLYLMSLENDDAKGRVLEIGSFCGKSSYWLAKGSQERNGEKIYCIDTFNGSIEHRELLKGQSTYNVFKHNLERAGVYDWVIPVKKSSREAFVSFDEKIGLLFIDGSHEYEDVKADLLTWEQRLIKGGMVILHDSTGQWDGPTRVADEWIIKRKNMYRDVVRIKSMTIARKIVKDRNEKASNALIETEPVQPEMDANHPRLQPDDESDRCTTWADLQDSLTARPDKTEMLQTYFNEAVAAGELGQARGFFDQLLRKYPWNHSIRKLFIALCLKQKDYCAAMDAAETLVAFSKPDDGLIDSALSIRAHLGPRPADRHSAKGSSISLCMIVKNEQTFLGPCLNSIKNFVDEIIVVDTGSTDRSADIAKIFGAQVFNEPWRDDFSYARNISLEKAHGDWIFILDADEVIAPQDFGTLRAMIRSDRDHPKAYSIQTRNYVNLANTMDWHHNDRSYPQQEAGIGWFPTSKVRLFPNRSGIRFEYPVHEMVDEKIKAAAIPIRPCPIPVHHYGHLNEAKSRLKAEVYFKLGYAKLDQLGSDCSAIRELAVQAGQLGRWQQAVDLWQRLLDEHPDYHEACANLAGAYWQLGNYELGVDFANKAIRVNPAIREGHYNLAVNLIMKRQVEEAASILQKLTMEHPQYLPAKFMLSAAMSILGDRKSGREGFSDLEKAMSPKVLSIAVGDIVQKLKNSGLNDYADAIHETAMQANG